MEALIPPHTFPNCQWQECPEHNPEKDPNYTPAMQWTSAAPGAQQSPNGDAHPAGDVMSICSWCPQLKILSLQRRENDVVVILLSGEKHVQVWRNNVKLWVSYGICEPCQAKTLSERSQEEPNDERRTGAVSRS